MKTPEEKCPQYANGYCGCKLCVGNNLTPNYDHQYQILAKHFGNSVIYFKTRKFSDSRGAFQVNWNKEAFENEIVNKQFVQTNTSYSINNVFRGMHFQIDKPQAKLVNILQGKIVDFVIDIRKDSPFYGNIGAYLLNSSDIFLYIPEGFAHGFLTLDNYNIFNYMVSDNRSVSGERGISLFKTIDPNTYIDVITPDNTEMTLNMDNEDKYIMSDKDKNTVALKDYDYE